MSEWTGITGYEGWRGKLGELLDEAKEVAREDDIEARFALSDRLLTFMKKSRPNSEDIRALDELAREAAADLMKMTIEERLAAVSERTGRYLQLTKEIEARAAEAQAAAASIRLENVVSVIDTTTQAIESIQKLRESLKDTATDRKIADLIDETITAVETLRSRVAKLV